MEIAAYVILGLFYLAGAMGVGAAITEFGARSYAPIAAAAAIVFWPLLIFGLWMMAITERLGD